jgi:hypothetical protein
VTGELLEEEREHLRLERGVVSKGGGAGPAAWPGRTAAAAPSAGQSPAGVQRSLRSAWRCSSDTALAPPCRGSCGLCRRTPRATRRRTSRIEAGEAPGRGSAGRSPRSAFATKDGTSVPARTASRCSSTVRWSAELSGSRRR